MNASGSKPKTENITIQHVDPGFPIKRNVCLMNKNTEYDTVMKQFDDLIFELNVLGNRNRSKDSAAQPDNLLSIVQDVTNSGNSFKSFESNPKKGSVNINSDHVTFANHCNMHVFGSALSGQAPCKQNYPTFSDQNMEKIKQPEAKTNLVQKSTNQTRKNKSMTDPLASDSEKFSLNSFPTSFIKNITGSYQKCEFHLNKSPALEKDFEPYINPILTNVGMNYFIDKQNPKQYNKGFPHSNVVKTMALSVPNFAADSRFWNQGNLKIGSPRIPRSSSKHISPNQCFMVKLFIETKDCHLGPFTFEIYPRMTLRLLKLKVEEEYGIDCGSQCWILGTHFAVDNDRSLIDYNVVPDSSVFLYVDSKSVKYKTNTYQKLNKNTAKRTFSMGSSDENESGACAQASTVNHYTGTFEGSYEQLFQAKMSPPPISSVKDNKFQSKNHAQENSGVLKKSGKISDSQLDGFPAKGSVLYDTNIDEDLNSGISLEEFHHPYTHQKSDSEEKFYEAQETTAEKASFLNQELANSEYSAKPVVHMINQMCNGTAVSQSDISEVNGIGAFDSSYSTESDCVKALKPVSYLELKLINDLPSTSKIVIIPGNMDILLHEFVNENIEETFSKDVLTGTDINVNNSDSPMDFVSCYRNINIAKKDDSLEILRENSSLLKTVPEPEAELTWVENYAQAVKMKGEESFSQSFVQKQLPETNQTPVAEVQNSYQQVTQNPDKPPRSKKSVAALLRKLIMMKSNSSEDSCTKDSIDETNDVKHIEEKSHNQMSFIDVHVEILKEPEIVPETHQDEEQQIDSNSQIDAVDRNKIIKNFEILMEIENMDLVQNTMNFKCPICFEDFDSGQGVVLHDCLHTFCRDCLINTVIHSDGALIKCPYRDDVYSCQSHLQQREIKALVTEDVYEKYLQRSIITAEGVAERSFHCKTLNCLGWCIYDNAINVFHCPVCLHYNCLNCQAIHEGMNCRQYQDKLREQQKVDHDAEKTLEFLNKMIDSGKALRCPKCDLILMKKWGCDWLKCSICKTEICWITKGPRWGPGGQGDTSGGCRCGVNGVKCHPSCTYCH